MNGVRSIVKNFRLTPDQWDRFKLLVGFRGYWTLTEVVIGGLEELVRQQKVERETVPPLFERFRDPADLGHNGYQADDVAELPADDVAELPADDVAELPAEVEKPKKGKPSPAAVKKPAGKKPAGKKPTGRKTEKKAPPEFASIEIKGKPAAIAAKKGSKKGGKP